MAAIVGRRVYRLPNIGCPSGPAYSTGELLNTPQMIYATNSCSQFISFVPFLYIIRYVIIAYVIWIIYYYYHFQLSEEWYYLMKIGILYTASDWLGL